MDNNREGKILKILFASPYKIGIGGVCQWADNIMDYYYSNQGKGYEVDVLPLSRVGLRNFKSRWKRIKRGVMEYSRVISTERKMLKAKKYDVFHLCTSASLSLLKDLVLLSIAKRHHVSTVIHFHFGRIPALAKANNWEWKLLRRVVKMSDVAIPIDQMSYDTLIASGFSNVQYLPNPVSQAVSDFVNTYQSKVNVDERMVLYAGHCIKTKGVYELVRACSEIENIRLLLAGRVYDEEIRQDLVNLSHNGQWLEILGMRPHEEVLQLMLQCGVFVLPSYTEGFPNVILESMACGCAIVATTVGAIPEMIGEEEGRHFGLLVPPQDSDSLRDAIKRLLSDKALREECRSNAQQRVNKKYNIESVWGKLTQIWCLASNNRQGIN